MSRSRPGGGAIVTAAGIAGAAGFVIGSRHLLSRQAAKARAVIGKPLGEQALQADRVYKKRFGAEVDLLMLGDSTAAGLGADLPSHTLGTRLAKDRTEARRVGKGGVSPGGSRGGPDL